MARCSRRSSVSNESFKFLYSSLSIRRCGTPCWADYFPLLGIKWCCSSTTYQSNVSFVFSIGIIVGVELSDPSRIFVAPLWQLPFRFTHILQCIFKISENWMQWIEPMHVLSTPLFQGNSCKDWYGLLLSKAFYYVRKVRKFTIIRNLVNSIESNVVMTNTLTTRRHDAKVAQPLQRLWLHCTGYHTG